MIQKSMTPFNCKSDHSEAGNAALSDEQYVVLVMAVWINLCHTSQSTTSTNQDKSKKERICAKKGICKHGTYVGSGCLLNIRTAGIYFGVQVMNLPTHF